MKCVRLFLAASLILSSGCLRPVPPGPPPPTEPPPPPPGETSHIEPVAILADFNIRFPQPGRFVITNQRQWGKLFGADLPAVPDPIVYVRAPDIDVPPVRFSEAMALAVSLGVQRTGGHSVKINDVVFDRRAHAVVARVEIRHPRPGDLTTQAITIPGHAVVIPQRPGRVVFRRVIDGQPVHDVGEGNGHSGGRGQDERPDPLGPLPGPTPGPTERPPQGGGPDDLPFEIDAR